MEQNPTTYNCIAQIQNQKYQRQFRRRNCRNRRHCSISERGLLSPRSCGNTSRKYIIAAALAVFLLSLTTDIADTTFYITAEAGFTNPISGTNFSATTNSKMSASTGSDSSSNGKLEELKQKEIELLKQLESIQYQKQQTIKDRPLTIGVMGFGRFGQFMAQTFLKYGRVVVTSRSDYTDIAQSMGVTYIKGTPEFLNENLDVIIIATSIVSFETSVRVLVPHLQNYIQSNKQQQQDQVASLPGPLIVDALSVKEHPRKVLLELLPNECDIVCTHAMFGPDSAKHGWTGLNFVYEKTRIAGVVHHSPNNPTPPQHQLFVDASGGTTAAPNDQHQAAAMDRVERFLSIWEEEGCRMVPMSCYDHDAFAANSQFITHLVGRVLGSQGLTGTPIDTSGFRSVLALIDSTTSDSFDLFYGLYKYNTNSASTIMQLQTAINDVVTQIQLKERLEEEQQQQQNSKL